MTNDEIAALVTSLDPGAKVTFADDGRAQVVTTVAMTVDSFADLLRDLADVQVSIGSGSPAWAVLFDGLRDQSPTGPSYDLDDLEDDGTWKPGREPEGWVELP